MVLDAYYKNLATQLSGNPEGFSFKDYSGTERTYTKMNSAYPNNLGYMASDAVFFDKMNKVNTSAVNNNGVVFGDGTTEVSKDDYKLSGKVISTFSASAAEKSTHGDGLAVKSMVYTITNTGSEPITISEIGYYGRVAYSTSDGYNTLLERTLLETPLTIPAGGVGQVTYTIRMNYPTA